MMQVGVTDNGTVKKGQVLFRDRSASRSRSRCARPKPISPWRFRPPESQRSRSASPRRRCRSSGSIWRPAGSSARSSIDLVSQRALAETNAIRARADISKTQADVRRAEAELERARENLGAAGYANPKVQAGAGRDRSRRASI